MQQISGHEATNNDPRKKKETFDDNTIEIGLE